MADEPNFEEEEETPGAGAAPEGANPETPENPNPQTPPKEPETPEAKRARLARELERHDRKYPDLAKKPETPTPAEPSPKSGELDYGQKAFLLASGIKEAEELDLVNTYMKESGKSLDETLVSKYFQGELKTLREDLAAKAALPSGSNRTGSVASDTVEYWLSKGELPPKDNPKLRQEVVNARIKADTKTNVFTDNPVVK